MQNNVFAPLRIEHDLRLRQGRYVIVKAPHLERARREKAMAARDVAGGDTIDVERDDIGLFRLRPERRDNRMQRAHPA